MGRSGVRIHSRGAPWNMALRLLLFYLLACGLGDLRRRLGAQAQNVCIIAGTLAFAGDVVTSSCLLDGQNTSMCGLNTQVISNTASIALWNLALAGEASARASGDATLQAEIDLIEAQQVLNGSTSWLPCNSSICGLQTQVTSNTASITLWNLALAGEAAARASGDATLQAEIDLIGAQRVLNGSTSWLPCNVSICGLNSGLSSEASTRAAEDLYLQNQIDNLASGTNYTNVCNTSICELKVRVDGFNVSFSTDTLHVNHIVPYTLPSITVDAVSGNVTVQGVRFNASGDVFMPPNQTMFVDFVEPTGDALDLTLLTPLGALLAVSSTGMRFTTTGAAADVSFLPGRNFNVTGVDGSGNFIFLGGASAVNQITIDGYGDLTIPSPNGALAADLITSNIADQMQIVPEGINGLIIAALLGPIVVQTDAVTADISFLPGRNFNVSYGATSSAFFGAAGATPDAIIQFDQFGDIIIPTSGAFYTPYIASTTIGGTINIASPIDVSGNIVMFFSTLFTNHIAAYDPTQDFTIVNTGDIGNVVVQQVIFTPAGTVTLPAGQTLFADTVETITPGGDLTLTANNVVDSVGNVRVISGTQGLVFLNGASVDPAGSIVAGSYSLDAPTGVIVGTTLEPSVGVLLPTSGGTPSVLNYYEEFEINITLTIGTSTLSTLFTFTRVGRVVTLLLPAISINNTAAIPASITSAAIPIRYRPNQTINMLFEGKDNNVGLTSPALAALAATGVLTLSQLNGVGFTSGALCGSFAASTFTWSV